MVGFGFTRLKLPAVSLTIKGNPASFLYASS